MSNDIRGLERWEGETKEYNRRAGKLRMQTGPGIIDALEHWYSEWKKKKTPRNQREYMLWRLRLHVKHNDNPEFLAELNELFDINLCDEEIGKTFWDLEPVKEYKMRSPYNWRRDSGAALRGGTLKSAEEEEQVHPEQPNV